MKINEAKFYIKNDFIEILESIRSSGISDELSSAISELIDSNLTDVEPLWGTNIKLLNSNDVEYIRPIKGKPVDKWPTLTVGLTRFLTRICGDLKINITPANIDNLARLIKSNRDLPKVRLKLVVGEAIRWSYLIDNCENYSSLGGSCMNKKGSQEYLDIYVKNPDKIALLVVIGPNDKILARRLVWNTDNKGITVDTIYSSNSIFRNLLVQYCKNPELRDNTIIIPDKLFSSIMNDEEKNWLTQWEQHLTKEWGIAATTTAEITLNIKNIDYMPYLDTYYYINRVDYPDLILTNTYSNMECKSQNGEIITKCYNCNGGELDCNTCGGTGNVDCENCEAGEIEITTDNGEIELLECPDCNGTGELDCPDKDAWNSCNRGTKYCEYCEDGSIIEDLSDIC